MSTVFKSPFGTTCISPICRSIPNTTSASHKNTLKSACWARFTARSIPNFSIGSFVSRIPAVSTITTGNPFKSIWTSTTSRVVPAYCEVIAASRPASALSKVDLPTFGGPTITTSNPSRNRSAIPTPAISDCNDCIVRFSKSATSGITSTGTSSSTKSIVASSKHAALIRSSRHILAESPIAPASTLCA